MAVFNKFDAFTEHIAEGVHNLGTGSLTIALTNTAPVSTNTALANITEISYTNISTSRILSTTSSAQSAGVYKLTCADLTLSATGSVGPFRYVVLYNASSTGVTNALIGWWDYGSSITLASGETFTVDLDQTNGVLQLS